MIEPLRLRLISPDWISFGGNPKNEWIVWPPAVTAASPVGATTTFGTVTMSRNARSRVDLPVPARPVTNKWP